MEHDPGATHLPLTTTETTVPTWQCFMKLLPPLARESDNPWCFRGQMEDHKLSTTFERLANNLNVAEDKRRDLEWRLCREFQRSYATVATMTPPADDDYLGWLGVMQHHGAPTRLLDWTYSPYIAACFALEERLRAPDSHAAVWALPTQDLRVDLEEFLTPESVGVSANRKRLGFRLGYLRGPNAKPKRVGSVSPYHLHDRLIAQQGFFLCPTDVTAPFEANLAELQKQPNGLLVRKFVLTFSRDEVIKALNDLRRMNIDSASLYPDLYGLAKSLHTRAQHLLDLKLSPSETNWPA